MIIPAEPIKPREPYKPAEFTKHFKKISLDEKNYSLEELLSHFPKEIKQEDIVFCWEYSDSYYDGGYNLVPGYYYLIKNKKYQTELKGYNKKYLKYQKELKKYEEAKRIYNTELATYNKWRQSEEKILIEEKLKKAIREVSKLQKQLDK